MSTGLTGRTGQALTLEKVHEYFIPLRFTQNVCP